MNPNLTTINTVAIRLRHLASAFDHTGNEFMAGVLREQSFVLDRAVMEMNAAEKAKQQLVWEAYGNHPPEQSQAIPLPAGVNSQDPQPVQESAYFNRFTREDL